ncbi:hypothetical protein Tco_1530748 [Tanacetum coccineum]
MPRKDIDAISETVKANLKVVVLEMVNETTNQNMRDNLLVVVKETIKLEREKTKEDIALMVANVVRKKHERTRAELLSQVSDDVVTSIPLQLTLMYKYERSASHIGSYRVDNFHSRDHEAHHDDDARPEGESSAKRQRTFEHKNFDPRNDDQGINDDEVPFEEVSPKLMAKILGKGMKSGPTIDDLKQMQDALNDMIRSTLKVNLTTPNLIFLGIEEQKPYTITSIPFIGLIYENSKKEKRIMDIDEIPKFCDATLKKVLKNVKKINLDVKHGYADPTPSKDDAEYMVFYERYIEEHVRHRDQMRRGESYVNGRPLRQR